MVGPGRFELPTSRLSGVRSNQLSYGPEARDQARGLEQSKALVIISPTSETPSLRTPAGDGGKEKRRRRRPAPV